VKSAGLPRCPDEAPAAGKAEIAAAPETSVIIPVRDGARFVAEAVHSVLAQLEPGDEILAVDDKSTDETRRVLDGIGHPAFRVVAGGGRGVSAARNVGLAAARGAFIAFLDHDDIWPAGRHRALIGRLKREAGLDAVFGRVSRRFEPDARITAESMVEGHHAYWLVGSGLYRRRLVERIGGFAEDMAMGEDLDFYARLSEAGLQLRLCDLDSLVRRHHNLNTTNDRSHAASWRLEVLRRKLARVRAASASRQRRD